MTPVVPFDVVQNAYLVPDLAAACHRFHELYGIGPFFRGRPHALGDVAYRGAPIAEPVVVEIACAQAGEVQIELIAESSPGPSCYRDMYESGEGGLHHTAVFTGDYEGAKAALVAAGDPVAMELSGPQDCRICYLDTRPVLGHMLELCPEVPAIRQVYAYIREQSTRWDRRELIQPLDFRAVPAVPGRQA
ncbi:VOC family protein [Amycolatopsis alkalitolerans]|uniref:ABC transporter permease n=1 Tax=Amycolatopsis alkalitolerans TaxID=2547244 RepID=A0A5C4LTC9_9PSEU|nr:VOC family protein [Amycolatopsis alkalitolerans]TNC20600.1 ABC transporter permease [Amycolatopsis alkalitolerans]